MILTCPECATSYFAEDSAIGSGRTVRCASCGASWRARAETPLELKVTPEEGAFAAETPQADQDLFDRPPSEVPAPELPKVFRARAENERRVREAVVQGAVWAGLGTAFAVVIGLGIVFRMDVVRLWPKAASAYASVGLPVNASGLTIENLRTQTGLQDGRPALVVSGVMRNIRAKPVPVPPLSIELLDKDGKVLVTRIERVGDQVVPPGQSRSFAVSLVDPPSAASDLGVTFAMDHAVQGADPARPRVAPKAEAPTPHAMVLTAPAEEARPLDDKDPYALH